MNDSPLSFLSLPADVRRRVLTVARLRAAGVTAAETNERCRPGGPWQRILPGVVLLHPGPPTHEERLHAVLMYAARERAGRVPSQSGAAGPDAPDRPDAVITGLAALSLHGFAAAPPLPALDAVDVLVPRLRRLRSTGCARIVRASEMPVPQQVWGLPVAPVERALTDAVTGLTDGGAVRRLLAEAVCGGYCEPVALVRELARARLLGRPHVVAAVDSLLAEGRAAAEDRMYAMVRDHDLPDPVWNPSLRLPGGPHLGDVDAYWPDQAVAVVLDTRTPRPDEDPLDCEQARRREYLEGLGITVVHVTPRKLRDASEQQAVVIRTALMASVDREPAAYVVVLPR